MTLYLQTLLLVVAAQIVLGYVLIKNRLAFLTWPNLLFWLMLAGALFFKASPILKMLALIAVTLIAMKIIVTAMSYKNTTFKLTFLQWLAFTIGWVGMRPQPFEMLPCKRLKGAYNFIGRGIICLVTGLSFILLARCITILPFNTSLLFIMCSTLLLIGFSLILHFGILAITAGAWRFFGADTYLLFRQPLRSTSLAEFWGKRWNLAFVEMLSIAVLRPL